MKRLLIVIMLVIIPIKLSWGYDCYIEYNDEDRASVLRDLLPLAESGNSSAQGTVAEIYFNNGEFQKSEKWYNQAAKNEECTIARENLCTFYSFEVFGLNDLLAKKWCFISAEEGSEGSQYAVGIMYLEGKVIIQNFAEAKKWFLLSAEQGNASSQTELGKMYLSGKGGNQSNIKAHMWFNIASVNYKLRNLADDYNIALKERDLLEKEMTLSEIHKSQNLALECQEKEYRGC